MSTEFKNAKVIFSNLRNRINKDMYAKEFSIEVPSDCEQIKQLQADFEALEEKAKKVYSEKEGKKVKGASREKGVGAYLFSDDYKEGLKKLKFIIYNIRDKEVVKDDGSKGVEKVEVLAPLYPELNFCYRVDNNGAKQYTTESGTPWLPLSENIINLKCSLRASYNKSDSRVTIKLKADEIEIISSNYASKGGPSFLSLDEDLEISKRVENTPKVKEQEVFSASDLADLDI